MLETLGESNVKDIVIKKALEEDRFFDPERDVPKGDIMEMLRIAHDMRILFPEFNPRDHFSPGDVQEVRSYFKRDHAPLGLPLSKLKFVYNANIVMADEIRVTDRGIEIITVRKQLPLDTETPPIPEKRRF